MCRFRQLQSLLAVLLAAHCGGDVAHDGTTADAGPDLGKPQPDGVSSDREVTLPDRDTSSDAEGGVCCPISDAPACCMQYGGSPGPQRACGSVCDGMPWPSYPGWQKRVDENGCPFWWTPPDAPDGCFPGLPDARADAKNDADVSSDADGGLCCPISPAPACCMQYGGSAPQFACFTVCDGMPAPGYPGWERRTDGNGCPYWWTPADAPRACGIVFPDVRVDADASGDADVTLDAVSRPDGDAPGNLDVQRDGDAIACCPISPAPGCCMEFGGTPGPNNSCGTVCDNLPAPTYPGWEQRVDPNGCPSWYAPPTAPIGCGIDSGTFG